MVLLGANDDLRRICCWVFGVDEEGYEEESGSAELEAKAEERASSDEEDDAAESDVDGVIDNDPNDLPSERSKEDMMMMDW